MPAQRKRKHAAVDDQHASKQARPAKVQKSINAFATVGKQHDGHADTKKSKAAKQDVVKAVSPTKANIDKKRKRKADPIESDDEIIVSARSTATKETGKPVVASTSHTKRFRNAVLPTPAETPTKSAAALFDKLKIDPNSRTIPLISQKQQQQRNALNTPPLSPKAENDGIDLTFPSELEDLQDLYAAFLTSLSLYYAHNGASSPVELSGLLSVVTKSWRKRKVTLEDLQRTLGIGQKEQQQFVLQDYGRAGICLTQAQPRGRALKRTASYVDEDELNRCFEDTLQKIWYTWQRTTPQENRTGPAFIAQLPLLEIPLNESVEKAAPLFTRGQQRLADLKASAKKEYLPSSSPIVQQPSLQQAPTKTTQTRGTALLDRILAKQSLSSSLPAGPTRAQLERKAALHRVEDVAKVLSLLVGVKERCSFTLPVVTQHLQQSLRNPISREEVERCVDVLAGEIVPGFVRVVRSGEVKCAVVTRSAGVSLVELRGRVERTLGEMSV